MLMMLMVCFRDPRVSWWCSCPSLSRWSPSPLTTSAGRSFSAFIVLEIDELFRINAKNIDSAPKRFEVYARETASGKDK